MKKRKKNPTTVIISKEAKKIKVSRRHLCKK